MLYDRQNTAILRCKREGCLIKSDDMTQLINLINYGRQINPKFKFPKQIVFILQFKRHLSKKIKGQ